MHCFSGLQTRTLLGLIELKLLGIYSKGVNHQLKKLTFLQLIVGLKKDGKIMIPNSNFDNEAIRYDHRFAPFNSMLTPPSMPYRFHTFSNWFY